MLVFGFRKTSEDERVRLVSEFGDEREVITPAAIGVVKIPGVVM